MRPSVASPTGTVIGPAGVHDLGAARQAVGRVHRDCAEPVVAEVLLHLADERAGLAAVDRDRVVDVGQLVRENGLDHDALDLLDAAHVPGLSCGFQIRSFAV